MVLWNFSYFCNLTKSPTNKRKSAKFKQASDSVMLGLLLATLLRSIFSNSSQSRRTVAMSNCCRRWSKIRRFWKVLELLNGKRQIFVYFGHLWSFWINLRGQLRYSTISILFWLFSFDFSDIFRALFDPLLTTLWQQKKSVCCLKATLWFWSEHELKACFSG